MNKRHAATLDELRACVKWLDACIELGWADENLVKLEELWWRYHPPQGDKE